MSRPYHPAEPWLSRCKSELSALLPFCAPALYGSISQSELRTWAEGIWHRDGTSPPEIAAHKAMVQMMAMTTAPARGHGTSGNQN